MALEVWRRFGTRALLGFAKLVAFTRYPAKVIARYEACTTPREVDELIAEAPSARAREQLELTFRGSAMELIDRFFPDEERHRALRAQLAFALAGLGFFSGCASGRQVYDEDGPGPNAQQFRLWSAGESPKCPFRGLGEPYDRRHPRRSARRVSRQDR